ncbi:MAG: type II toxin-antitoxin system HicA family toxin [Nitrosarchaeum sp.]|nr:type II toxin-antitoxin system HicA family toxin [Nitrosarchaeum sp.]
MTNLPVISSDDLIKFLTKEKKFVYDRTRGSHHIFISTTKRVSIPERKELGKGLFRQILLEIGVSETEFITYWNS